MPTRVAFWTLCLALLVGAAWYYRDAPFVHDLLQGRVPAAVSRSVDGLSTAMKPPAAASAGAADSSAGGVRKCLVGGKVLYTNDDCPAGGRERPLSGGTVSVVPAAPVAARAEAGASAAIPHARDLLIQRDGVDLQDKRMEKLEASIGK